MPNASDAANRLVIASVHGINAAYERLARLDPTADNVEDQAIDAYHQLAQHATALRIAAARLATWAEATEQRRGRNEKGRR
jgi:hypothetical protein